MSTSNKYYRWPACGLLFITLIVGCRSQPEVTSPEALVLIKKFYTAVNSRNEKRLANSEAEFMELVENKKLSDAEQQAFKEIVDLARDGDWDTAQKRALSFAHAQVR